jgi:hypothetical protein
MVFARFGKGCVMVALVLTTGAHWAALQTVAWTAMLADNLRTHSIAQAVCCTFDGRHPCCLCKVVAAGKKSEKKNEFTLQTLKLEFPPSPENFILVAPSDFRLLPVTNSFAESLTFRPPTPPPRSLFA